MRKCIFLPGFKFNKVIILEESVSGWIKAWAHSLTEREGHQRAVENRDTLKIVVVIVDD
jgi:hypothetical protein